MLFIEASHKNLQLYIASRNSAIEKSLWWNWSLQAVEVFASVHSKSVIHTGLQFLNYLIRAVGEPSPDLWFCTSEAGVASWD